jgi:ATP-dependent DNA helicase RecG
MSGASQAQSKPPLKSALKPAGSPHSAHGHPLLAPFPKLPGMTPQVHAKLITLCGPRWLDLLFHLPTRLLDRSATPTIAAAPVGEIATLVVTVTRRPALPPRGAKRPMSIELTDGTGTLRAIFFHAGSWLERAFPVGAQVIVSGKLEADAKGKKFTHPDVWAAGQHGAEAKQAQLAKLTPLYPATAGLGQGWLGRAIQAALHMAQQHPLPEWLPTPVRTEHHLPTWPEALTRAHNPTDDADLLPTTPARLRLGLDELFALQLALAHARAQTRTLPGLAHTGHSTLSKKLWHSLPYAPTASQTTALQEIAADLAAPRPMLRLLQGDVGSGKTLVAIMALLRVIEHGHQGVLMAPTSLLAEQLFTTAQTLLNPLGLSVALLVGSLTAAQKRKVKEQVANGFVQLLVGTQALIEDNVTFHSLGLAVIDEQHRFGVRQRVALSGKQALPPDILLMTATPIPRTLALTAYGDMDLSTLPEKPPGRTPITTKAVPREKWLDLVTRLKDVLASGQQAYWVCPLVEEAEVLPGTPPTKTPPISATERYASLQQHLPGIALGLLHGALKPADKDAAMRAFKQGETQLLVCTTVVEVGVDVPNATIIVIEHAERFGLSQLHQLRGRVGRGALPSQCVLLYQPPLTPFAQARLAALRDTDDGFVLAEKDLELRGPGEVLGTRQAGEMHLLLADLAAHRHLLPVAQQLAQAAFHRPLPAPQRNALATLLQVFDQDTAAAWLRGG